MQYAASEIDGVNLITCPPEIDLADPKAMDPTVKSWLQKPVKIHVLDFKNVTSIKPAAYRSFVLFNQALKTSGKVLFTINVSEEISKQFRTDGVSMIFQQVESVDEARKKVAPKSSIDLNFINPFVVATRTVLETQAGLSITSGKPAIKKAEDRIKTEITGVLALSCKELTGAVHLCFQSGTFLKIYESLTGEPHDTITPELEDAAAELLNIIFGAAKTVLNDQNGYHLDRTLPTVLSGEGVRLYQSARSTPVMIPFESSAGPFQLEIVIEKN